MAVEISSLVLEIDSTDVGKAGTSLDRFAASGGAAERAAQGVAAAGEQVSNSYRRVNTATSAAVDGAQRYIDALQRELNMLGKTREEIERQEAASRGFTRAEQAKVGALAASIEAYHRQAAAAKELAESEKRAADAAAAFVARLKVEADTLGMTRAQMLQYQAAQLGVTAAAAPLIAKLQEADKAIGAAGISTKQLNAAMRGVPAQLTDIFTGLASGQAPLTVLIQQGGQLKDMFGGLGNMARALGGYVLGLLNPFTLVAGAVAAVIFAYEKGAGEQREFQKTLILTGNSAGVTAGQLSAAAATIDQVSDATRGKAAEALDVFVNAGVKGRSELERFTLTAIEFERAGGAAVEKVAEQFANLAKDPLQASIKLNESTNYLTKSVYEQIKALEDQGRTTDAAKVAQEAYSDALRDRTPELLKNLGLIERAWMRIKDFTRGAADAALSVGRSNPLGDAQNAFAASQARIESLKKLGPGVDTQRAIAEETRRLESSRQVLLNLQEEERLTRKVATAKAEQATQLKAQIAFDKLLEESLDRQSKKARELAQARALGERAGASPEAIRSAEAAINKKYEEPAKKAKDPTQDSAYQEAMRAAKARQALRIKENEEIAEWQRAQEDLRKKFEERVDAEAAKREQAMFAASDSIRAQTLAQEQANEVFGKGKSALAELTLAQMEKSRADLESTNNVMPGAIKAIELQIEAQKRLVEALKVGEGQEKTKKITDDIQADFQKTADSISSMFSDALLRGFENGKGWEKNLKDVFKNLSKTLVLKPIIDMPVKAAAAALAPLQKQFSDFVAVQILGQQQVAASAQVSATSQVAASQAAGAAAATAGVANQAGGDPYTAFFRMAAMAAIMAGLGFAVSAGSKGSAPPASNQGTGTVFGDASAKSASIENSIDLLADSAVLGLRYSAQMAASLKNIEAAMTGVTNLLLRTNGMGDLAASIPTGVFDSTMSSIGGSIKRLLAPGPLGNALSGLHTKLFGKKTTIQGSGIMGGPQSFGDIESLGFQGNYYADVQTKSKFLGMTTSTKNSTILGPLDQEMARQFSLIFSGIGDSVKAAAGGLGLDLGKITERLNGFVVDIGKIDLKDLSGEEIQEKLAAVFGAEADKIAAAVVPGFERMQQVGEGYFETLVRAAHQMEVADLALGRMGMTIEKAGTSGDAMLDKALETLLGAPEVRRAVSIDEVIQQFGGLDQFTEATDEFYRAFWSQADQTRNNIDMLTKSLAGVGFELPTTASGFRDLVTGLDLTTAEGRQAFEVLTKVGPAFKQMQDDLLQGAGIGTDEMASIIRDGLLGRASQDDVGAKLGTMVTEGLQNALASSLADQITTSFTNTFLMPMLQSIVTTGTIGAALSQASIDGFVSEANAKIRAFNAVLSSPEIQGALTQLQNGLAGITGSMKGLTSAVTIASQTINDAARSTANAADIAYANDPSLRAYEASIQAAYKAKEAWEQVASTIVDEINRLRGVGASDTSLASAQSQFYIATAQARAGDLEAFKKLPGLSQLVEQVAGDSVATSLDLRRIKAQLAASLEGTLYGSSAPVALPDIPGAGGGYSAPSMAYQSGTSDVRTEIAGMRGEMKANLEASNIVLAKVLRVVERWEALGVPVINQPGDTLEVSP